MICQQTTTHTVKSGDSLYKIANMHGMTLEEIISLNPGADPYNLQVGSRIIVCDQMMMPQPPMGDMGNCTARIALVKQMRLAWEQHIYWTRMLLISIADRLGDQSAVTARLMRNPETIGTVFAGFYPESAVRPMESLIAQHLSIGGQLMTALRDRNMELATRLNQQWYENAAKLAAALAALNPNYDEERLRQMLFGHLQMIARMTVERLAGNYAADIEIFDQAEQDILQMADYLADGIMKQFPARF